jgi:hypothetical protein
LSFLSVLKSIGSVFGKVTAVVTPLEPVIAQVPVYGPAFDTVFNAIVGVEGLFVGATTAATTVGAAKKTTVTAIVNATTSATIDQAALSGAIDQIVGALNSLQAAQASLSPPLKS